MIYMNKSVGEVVQ